MSEATLIEWCSGIGGMRLGLDLAGVPHEVVAHSEIDPYASAVYARHWPETPNLGDLTQLAPEDVPDADAWIGGIPCQPFSVAGAQRGGDDERDLWPALFRLYAVCRPRWLVVENVPGLLTAGGGRWFGRLLADLASIGADVEWKVLGARHVGAPHRRDRLWITAKLPDSGHDTARDNVLRARAAETDADRHGPSRDVADAPRDRIRRPRLGTVASGACGPAGEISGLADSDPGRRGRLGLPEYGDESSSLQGELDGRGAGRRRDRPDCWCGRGEPWCCDPADMDDPSGAGCESIGIRAGESTQGFGVKRGREDATREPERPRPAQSRVGRVAHGIPNRVDRLRCLGNAVVPQAFAEIARRVWR